MAKKAFFDTETTGMVLWSDPSGAEHQPHIVQLAALLVDMETQETVGALDVIIKPDGWVIPADMTLIHGITNEQALDEGIPEKEAVSMLLDLIGENNRIAHNQGFDARIIRIATKRFFDEATQGKWKAGKGECTAQLSRKLVALPKTKVPTLQEAYTHFYGKPFEGAHSAMADTLACRDVYFAVQKQSS